MNILYQDLSLAKDRIIKRYMKNPNSSISAMFRSLRGKSYLSLIGDYPILATITNTISTLGIKLTRPQATYALNKSEELKCFSKKDKNELLNQLTNPSSVQVYTRISSLQQAKSQKTNNVSA